MKYILITTTFDNQALADQVIKALLEKRLISCAQQQNIKSNYWWQGKIEATDEILVAMKTREDLYKNVENVILKMHSYDIPQILMYKIESGLDSYLTWISNETQGGLNEK